MNREDLIVMNDGLQARARARADRLIELHHASGAAMRLSFAGLELVICPEVFSPLYGEGTHLLAEQICGLSKTEVILDVGTGSGALACLAAVRGAKTVVATDISPIAVECTQKNVERLGLQEKVEVRKGDLFASAREGEQFSMIVFNAPFLEGTPASWLERAILDEGYRTIERFVENVRGFLTRRGKVLLAWSSAGDTRWLQQQFELNGFRWRIVAQYAGEFDFFVYELRLEIGGAASYG